MDDAELLISLIGEYIDPQAAAQLRTLLQNARDAQNPQQWDAAVQVFRTRYRTLVKQQMRGFVPPPILALPGVRALVDELIDRALDEGEGAIADAAQEIELGPASAALSLPPVMLPAPAGIAAPPVLLGFRPPTGLALNFAGGPAGGGGALDYQQRPNPRLSGALGLKMGIVQVAALTILEETGGTYSAVTLLSGRFAPGIQLGFGFAITGMGGLIGLNRAVDAGALEAQFRSGALVNALFGDDPVGNSVATLASLGTVFRVRRGAHVIGPSVQMAWLKVGASALFNVDLGVFMQLPGPSRIDIIGSARAGIPLVFQLRLDIRGELDFARRVISIQAAIVDSFMMGVFKLQGEALFRMRYGADAYMVLTAGGFFPGFNPAPAEVPANLQRIGLALDLPVNLPVYLRAVGYLAVTPNTLQFGADMEAGFDGGVFSAEGHFILDALLQFDPFYFEVRFSAGFHIEVLGESFSGVKCWGTITGPGPLVIHANIAYETPFFLPDIEWSDTFTIGRAAPVDQLPGDIYASMLDELKPMNLRAENGDDPHVALALKGPSGELALLAPLGDLIWLQRLAPLNLDVVRLQNRRLPGPNGVTVTTAGQASNGPHERFNLGMYLDLSDAEKMNLNARVEEHLCGVRHTFPLDSGSPATRAVTFLEYRRPNPTPVPTGLGKLLSGALLRKVSDRGAAAQVSNLAPRVATVRETWQAGTQQFDTQAAAHISAKRSGTVAHLAMDTLEMEGI